jgi:colanic acid biosynthesis glycosyl transferase WcaI
MKLLLKKKHELLFCIAPPFHLGFLAIFYRWFKKTKIIYHIQDLQIDAARELKILKPDWIFSILFKMEKYILDKADIVSTISDGMKVKVSAKTRNPVRLFPNWVDTETFYPIKDNDTLKARWGFDTEDKLVLYSGSIGEKQGLDSLIRIADQLRSMQNIKLIICGTGPFREKLIEMAGHANLNNLFFLPLQGNDVFNDFLNIADVHLVLQKGDASDLVMPSKLTTILSVGGLPLVTANPGTSLADVIKEHQMGVLIPPEDEERLREAIITCCSNDFSRERANARQYAQLRLNKDNILEDMLRFF